VKLNIVDNSMPVWGKALYEPNKGGPFVVTSMEADDRPQDRVNMNEELGGSMLLLITKLMLEVLNIGIVMLSEDAAAVLRLNDVLLPTVQVDVHTT
jgi:hypothetical protein